jgi:cytochrome c-type biogenesis protein CcmH/NrfG
MRLDPGTLKWAALIVPIVAVPAVLFYVTHRGAERTIPSELAAPAAPAAAEHGSAGLEPLLERLENRLRAGGGSDADWELLAKTYDYLGRKSDAANARDKHRVAGAAAATPTTAAAAQSR